MSKSIDLKFPLLFRIARRGVIYCVDRIYYRKRYIIGKENVPPDGSPVMLVSNHQNALNDAFCVVTSLTDRRNSFLARGDVFALNKLLGKFLRWIGILPAYRLAVDGAKAMKDNYAAFDEAERRLISGRTVCIFPEGKHQEGHWLGAFSTGYLRLAFAAAELSNFEKDVRIVPMCNHYSGYYGMRNDMAVIFGEPLSLRPFYELYKSRPGMAKMEVNAIVHERVKNLMLDIPAPDKYKAIDFLRQNAFGSLYARKQGLRPSVLPEKLEADKSFVKTLLSLGQERMEHICGLASNCEAEEKSLSISDRIAGREVTILGCLLRTMGLVVLLPVAIACIWPSLISWFVPRIFSCKTRSPKFEGAFLLALNMLGILPVTGLITFFGTWLLSGSVWAGLIHFLLIPGILVFEWNYVKWCSLLIERFRFWHLDKSGRIKPLKALRRQIFEAVETLCQQEGKLSD